MTKTKKIQEAFIEYLPTGWACGLTHNVTGKLIDKQKEFFIGVDYDLEYLAK